MIDLPEWLSFANTRAPVAFPIRSRRRKQMRLRNLGSGIDEPRNPIMFTALWNIVQLFHVFINRD
jgi:hypothetical protein